MVERRRTERRRYQDGGRALAGAREPLHVAGCMLYWGEGWKAKNQVHISNSDPELLRLFVAFLRVYFHVCDEDVLITCNLFADHQARQHEIERFWLEALSLPESSLRKSIVNVYSKDSKKKRLNKLPYGTCRVVVNQTAVVQSIYGSIQDYGGFERPEWLG